MSREAKRSYARAYYAANRETERDRDKTRYDKNKEKMKSVHRRWKYGLSPQDYDDMVDSQLGLCAICHVQMELGGHRKDSVCVDHNHETGVVRALLCRKCNVGLGHFNDDPELAQSAADYLAAHEGN